MHPLVDIDNATVVLGSRPVLEGFRLRIEADEHTAVLGPNGAGKSTLMKLLTLQVYPVARPDGAPAVRVLGQGRWDVLALRSQMGIVSADLHDRFVQGNAGGSITGREAVLSGFFASQGLFSHLHVTPAMRQAAAEALERMGAARLADAALDRMSTGEARRVLIARALVHRPAALVLDEPTRGLDLVARHEFLERIRGLARGGTTIVLVTHHVEEIIPEIERVVLLAGGRVARDGPKPDVLRNEPLSEVFGAPVDVERVGSYFRTRVLERPAAAGAGSRSGPPG